MLKQRLQQAELKAKKRERIDLEVIEKEMRKADERKLLIISQRSKNKARFSQINNENYLHLVYCEYMTGAEKSIFTELIVLTELGTNAIIHPIKGKFCTITEISQLLKRELRSVRRLITPLIEKGLVYEFVDPSELKEYGRVMTERPLYINPEIAYSGDRNRVNAVLARQVMNYDHIEKRKVYLPWKLAYEPHDEYARLVERKEGSTKKHKMK